MIVLGKTVKLQVGSLIKKSGELTIKLVINLALMIRLII